MLVKNWSSTASFRGGLAYKRESHTIFKQSTSWTKVLLCLSKHIVCAHQIICRLILQIILIQFDKKIKIIGKNGGALRMQLDWTCLLISRQMWINLVQWTSVRSFYYLWPGRVVVSERVSVGANISRPIIMEKRGGERIFFNALFLWFFWWKRHYMY